MATTVTYKGQVLVTVDNSTKVLETSGTWCEDDFTLVDVSGGGGGQWTTDGFMERTEPSGAIVANTVTNIYAPFNHNTGITSFTSSTIKQIYQDDAFHGCTNLASVEMTAVITQFRAYTFMDCPSLVTAKFPNMTADIGNGAFRNDSALTLVDCGKANQIIANAFNGCTSLSTVILRKTSVASMQNTSAFANTPFASGGSGGTVYVPSALINSYKTANNWSTLYNAGTCTFVALEGSQYE